jgi:hypothetical protein
MGAGTTTLTTTTAKARSWRSNPPLPAISCRCTAARPAALSARL